MHQELLLYFLILHLNMTSIFKTCYIKVKARWILHVDCVVANYHQCWYLLKMVNLNQMSFYACLAPGHFHFQQTIDMLQNQENIMLKSSFWVANDWFADNTALKVHLSITCFVHNMKIYCSLRMYSHKSPTI